MDKANRRPCGARHVRKSYETQGPQDSALMALIRAIASRDAQKASQLLAESPELARQAVLVGATRAVSLSYYLNEIEHYVYGGDTALHIAAAAYDIGTSEALVVKGAKLGARNRRGAEPIHYAADGIPGSHAWNPEAQGAVIKYLIDAGADPNSLDKSGVTPLHRAVRTRCAAAVRALLAKGADPRRQNKNGSTPLHLAVQSTGRGGSGSSASLEQQEQIIVFLLEHGAGPTDKDARGKTVKESIGGDWVRVLLRRY